jgi:protein-S-isoprenylcysteine O-methyltransferase Ste14
MAFDEDRPSRREVRHRRKITGIHVASLLIGLAVGVFAVVAQNRAFAPWVAPAVTTAVFAAAMGLTIYWWRQIDEAARSAHLEAFF